MEYQLKRPEITTYCNGGYLFSLVIRLSGLPILKRTMFLPNILTLFEFITFVALLTNALKLDDYCLQNNLISERLLLSSIGFSVICEATMHGPCRNWAGVYSYNRYFGVWKSTEYVASVRFPLSPDKQFQ